MGKKVDVKKLSVTAMLSALAYICMFVFKFKVSFLTFDFKDAILAVISFLYGPVYAILSSVTVAFFEFITVSDTGLYGLIMNSLSSITFTCVCGLFYKYRRTLSGAIIGNICGVFAMTAVMMIANLYITPFCMGVTRSDISSMIPTLLLPFNLIKGIVNAAVTMIIYKPITTALGKVGLSSGNSKKTNVKKFIPLVTAALVLIVAAILIILFVLNGKIEIIA